MPSKAHQDDDGNTSWMRIALTIAGIILLITAIIFYRDWRLSYLTEIYKEEPDYMGVVELFKVMMIGFVSGLLVIVLGKIGQKGFETRKKVRNIN